MIDGVVYFIQVLFVIGIAVGSQVFSLQDKLIWLSVARYTVYILTISFVPAACRVVYCLWWERQGSAVRAAAARAYALLYGACVAALLVADQPVYQQDFVFICFGYLLVQYLEMAEQGEGISGERVSKISSGKNQSLAKKPITYGVGMACSYFEGYLTHILPSDGHKFVGFEENITTIEDGGKDGGRHSMTLTAIKHKLRPAGASVAKANRTKVKCGTLLAYYYFEEHLIHLLPSNGAEFVGVEDNIRELENQEGILFPVKKMFIVVTKSLYSPPNLKEFNRGTDGVYLESFNILPEVKKSVAGVKDRIYHNTAYKLYRPRAPPVCLIVECASPLHTLHRVLCNAKLYDELADIDIEEVKNDFCNTLVSILNKSPECRGKCEFIHYDHEDESQHLPEILLARIRELCPNFEEKILARQAENKIIREEE